MPGIWLLVLCIFCNVLLAVIFKGFAHYKVDNLRAIILNYFVCVVVSSLFIGTWSVTFSVVSEPWFYHSLVLASLFIVGFNLLAIAFQKAGISLTVMLQKMSLLMPVFFAVLLFGEPWTLLHVAGILMAIVAVVLVNLPGSDADESSRRLGWNILIYPVLVFLLSGLIEIILYHVQAGGYLGNSGIQFTATSFCIAGIMGFVFLLLQNGLSRLFSPRDVAGGIILGIPNFLTIYLLIYLLGEGWAGAVLFPLNNVSILLLTSIVGYLFFKEKVGTMKLIGLLAGTLAIVLLGT
jgi:drug/metabolite transporter (DMT)-like permease